MAWSVHLIDLVTLDLDWATIESQGYITLTDIIDGDLGPLTTASDESLDYGWKRLAIGDGGCTIKVTDPLAVTSLRLGKSDPRVRELWFVEGDRVRWMGVVGEWDVKPADVGNVSLTLREAGPYYLWGKVFGRADRINLLTDGGFEDVTLNAAWVEEDTGGVLTVSIDSTDANEGAQSLKIVGTANDTSWVKQDLATINHGYDPALGLVYAGWVKVTGDDTTVPEGTLLAQFIAYGDNGSPLPGNPYVADVKIPAGGFTYGEWVRVSCGVELGHDIDWDVTLRLYGVDGTIRWDSNEAVFPDATTVPLGSDVADLLAAGIEYLNDPGSGQSAEQVDHDITAVGIVPPGPIGYPHSLHEGGLDSLVRTCQDHGIDLWWGENRIWHADAHRGSVLDGTGGTEDFTITITLDDSDPENPVAVTETGGGFELIAFNLSGDPSQEWSTVIVIGEGTRFSLEEVGRVDPDIATTWGGRVKTKVFRAPASATVRSMGDQADQSVKEGSRPAALPTFTLKVTDLDKCPREGDLIPVLVQWGCVQFDDDADGPTNLRIETAHVFPTSYAVRVSVDVDWAA